MKLGAVILLTTACRDPISAPEIVFDLSAELSETIPTVVVVDWGVSGIDVDEAWVEFGPELSSTAPAEEQDGGFRSVLLGNKPSTTCSLRAVAVSGGETFVSEVTEIETGPVPTDLASVSAETFDPERASGGFVVTSLEAWPATAVILDAEGDYTWWYTPGEAKDLQMTRARISRDGEWMLFLRELVGGGSYGFGRIRLDGTDLWEWASEDLHHDFVELPDGTIALLAHDERTIDGEPMVGDQVIELSPDGEARVAWSLWDHDEPTSPPAPSPEWDWSHANALDHDEAEDAYYISFRNLRSIYKIDRASGEVLWRFGGERSDFEIAPDGDHISHQFEVDDSTLRAFHNGIEDESLTPRVVEYALDEAAGTANEEWSYTTEDAVVCVALGDVSTLPTGNLLVTWSAAGQLDEVTEDGELLWQLNAGFGGVFGYTTWTESLYP